MKNDSNTGAASAPTAWIAVDHGLGTDLRLAPYTLVLKGDRSLYQTISEGDWVLVLNQAGEIVRTGRMLRLRSDLETTTIFFDRMLMAESPASIGLTSPRRRPPVALALFSGRTFWSRSPRPCIRPSPKCRP